MKKFLASLVILCTMTTTALAGSSYPIVPCYLHTNSGTSTQYGILVGDKTYLPLNTFRELTLTNGDHFDVSYTSGDSMKEIVIQSVSNVKESGKVGEGFHMDIIGTDTAWRANALGVHEDVQVINKDGYNYVPLSFMRKAGLQIDWDPVKKTVTIPGILTK